MINVSIGGMTVPVEKASEGWINQMIVEARKRGASLCIQVGINIPGIQVSLATPGCGGFGGGGRQANGAEQRIIDAWNRRGLSSGDITPGALRAFLNDLARLT